MAVIAALFVALLPLHLPLLQDRVVPVPLFRFLLVGEPPPAPEP